MPTDKDLKHLNHVSDYKVWKRWFEFYVAGIGLEAHLESNTVPQSAELKKQHMKERNRLMATLYKVIDNKYITLIEGVNTPFEALKSLDKTFKATLLSDLDAVEKDIHNFRFSHNTVKMFLHFRTTITRYKLLNGDLSDNQIAKKIISIFPDNVFFTHIKGELKNAAIENENKYILEDVLQKLEDAAKNSNISYKEKNKIQKEPKKSFNQVQHSIKIKGVCRNCAKRGHFKSECRNAPVEGKFCYICGEKSHLANLCPQLKQTKTQNYANEKSNVSQWSAFLSSNKQVKSSGVTFCLDSGCTSHCTGDRSLLSNVRKGEMFQFENSFGSIDQGNEVGSLTATLENNSLVNLNQVLFSPKMSANLLSVRDITKKGGRIIFEKDYAKIYNPDGSELYTSPFNGRFYAVTLHPETNTTLKSYNLQVWHERFGHIGKTALKEMFKNNIVNGLKLEDVKENVNCEACLKGNLKRKNVRKTISDHATDYVKASKFLERLCLDTVGPMDVRSIHGYRGFVTITDEFSKFRWVVLIKTRAEVPEKLIKLFKYIFREFDVQVQKIRSDNGSEFTNKKLASFLESYGIIHEFS